MNNTKGLSEINVELLAPVGSVEALTAAINAGADAVYLAGNKFGARKYAKNFDDDELAWAIRYSHIRGVKVYVTMNTLVHNNEIDEYFEMVEYLYNNDVDAIIVQDLGMLSMLTKVFPGLEVHASTQMTLHSSLCVKQMESMNVPRSVLARELSADEVKYIKENTHSELEVFASGALCVSYSGQCLMSSLIGGRSGNRGTCAQSCRQSYELIEEGKKIASGYLLSTKDLQVTDAEKYYFDSLKIEGRLKRPEYVYAAVSLYRAVLDKAEASEIERLSKRLDKVFSRGFTRGLLGGDSDEEEILTFTHGGNKGYKIGRVSGYDYKSKRLRIKAEEEIRTNDEIQIIGVEGKTVGARVEYVDIKGSRGKICPKGTECEIPFKHEVAVGREIYRTLDSALIQSLAEELREPLKKVKVNISLEMKIGKLPRIIISDREGNVVEALGDDEVQKAQKAGISFEKVKGSLEKLGDTAYDLDEFTLDADEEAFAPVSMLNSLRRGVCSELDNIRALRHPDRAMGEINIPQVYCKGIDLKEPELTVCVRNIKTLEAGLAGGARVIYFESFEFLDEAIEKTSEAGGAVYLKLPRIIGDDEYDRVKTAMAMPGLSGVVVANYGSLYLAKSEGINFRTDTSFNVFNSLSFKVLGDMGAESIALSHELNIDDIGILNEYGLDSDEGYLNSAAEVVIFGRVPVMISAYPLAAKVKDGGKTLLKDGKGKEFEIERDLKGRSVIYNADILFNFDEIDNIRGGGVSSFRLDFKDESAEFVEYVVKNAAEYLYGGYIEMNDFKDYVRNYYGLRLTGGHLKRGVE